MDQSDAGVVVAGFRFEAEAAAFVGFAVDGATFSSVGATAGSFAALERPLRVLRGPSEATVVGETITFENDGAVFSLAGETDAEDEDAAEDRRVSMAVSATAGTSMLEDSSSCLTLDLSRFLPRLRAL